MRATHGVSTVPGAMQLTRTPSSMWSMAAARVSERMPPFAAHVEHRVPVFFRRLRRGRGDAHAGVVHHDVESAPLFDYATHKGLHLVLFGDVGSLDERVVFELGGDLVGALLVHIRDHDPRVFLGHTQGYCPPDPRTRAGDDGALALQAPHMLSPCAILIPPSPLPYSWWPV